VGDHVPNTMRDAEYIVAVPFDVLTFPYLAIAITQMRF